MRNWKRPERAAPPLCSRDFYEKVNPFWLDQAARAKRQAASRKQQAASKKEFDKPIDLWDKVI